VSSLRVVSLVPSVTETLLAWGIEPAGVTRFCEQPSFPAVGGTKDPDVDAIVSLGPDVVVMCVEENRREDADALRDAGLEVLALEVESVADVAVALRVLADRLGLSGVEPIVVPVVPEVSVRAWVPIWRRPWMALGPNTYGSDLLATIGVATVAPVSEDRYPTCTLDEMASLGPDVVLAPSEPYPFAGRHVAELSAVAPVVLVDGQDLLWWGVRTPAAGARLAAVLARTIEELHP